MIELNELTKRLLAEGWSKDNPPPDYIAWNDYYGGWQYSLKQTQEMVVETPCGLCQKGFRVIDMGYMGIDWCLENNNATVICPYRKKGCEQNHPLLRDTLSSGVQIYCATALSDREYEYERSVDLVCHRNEEQKERDIKKFAESKKGRFCRHQVSYNDWTREVYVDFDPMICATGNCDYCTLLDRPFSGKKGNVFYDVKTITLKEAYGLIPEQKQIAIKKGMRLFERPVKIEVCELIATKYPKLVRYKVENSRDISRALFWKRYHGKFFEYEVFNIRAEKRESRDLIQDLQDVKDGIYVMHQSDLEKDSKAAKRDRAQKAKNARAKKMLLDVANGGVESINRFKLDAMLRKEMLTEEELNESIQQYNMRQQTVQLSLFE